MSVFAGICYLGSYGAGCIHLIASKCREVRGWTEPIVGSICQARIYLLGLVSTSHQTLAGRNSSRKRFFVQNALQIDNSRKADGLLCSLFIVVYTGKQCVAIFQFFHLRRVLCSHLEDRS